MSEVGRLLLQLLLDASFLEGLGINAGSAPGRILDALGLREGRGDQNELSPRSSIGSCDVLAVGGFKLSELLMEISRLLKEEKLLDWAGTLEFDGDLVETIVDRFDGALPPRLLGPVGPIVSQQEGQYFLGVDPPDGELCLVFGTHFHIFPFPSSWILIETFSMLCR